MMHTECTTEQLVFQGFSKAPVVADFNGGSITSDAGALLLSQVENARSIIERFAACFVDHRNPASVRHSLESMVFQRVVALALGYEDINDHEQLRYDPVFQMICRRAALPRADEPTEPLAGKSTLQRAETPGERRYHRVDVDEQKFGDFFVDTYCSPPDGSSTG